jgi:hypothetical protein
MKGCGALMSLVSDHAGNAAAAVAAGGVEAVVAALQMLTYDSIARRALKALAPGNALLQ